MIRSNCEYPECPTKETTEAIKTLSDQISDYKIIETDIRYIREMVDRLDIRITKDIDNLFERLRKVESEKIDKKDLFAAIGVTGTFVGILSFIVQLIIK